MKGLKKVALASAIAAVSAGAQAELKALDDATMGELTGQAGITIDVETKWEIGEFAYVDAGALIIEGIRMGGHNTVDPRYSDMLDNYRLTIDIAGSGAENVTGNAKAGLDNELAYGMSEIIGLAQFSASRGQTNDNDMLAAAGALPSGVATDGVSGARIDTERTFGDGDLVIHVGFTDAWEKGGGFAAFASGNGQLYNQFGSTPAGLGFDNLSYADAKEIVSRAVDFKFEVDAIGLAGTTYVADLNADGSTVAGRFGKEGVTYDPSTTDATKDTTALISDISMQGYLGPVDIHIENNGNGFGTDGSAIVGNDGNADSKIHWDSFFKVTDLDLYIDIAGVQLSDIQIHNMRGDTTSLNQVQTGVDASGNAIYENTASFGFAHSKRDIYAVKDAVLNIGAVAAGLASPTAAGLPMVDGIAINTEFKGDIDIGALSFGDTGMSIGSIHLTDVQSTTNWTISAH